MKLTCFISDDVQNPFDSETCDDSLLQSRSRIMGYLLSCVQSPVNLKTDDGQFLADTYQAKQ